MGEDQLLNELDGGKVVFFCGAGVSVGASSGAGARSSVVAAMMITVDVRWRGRLRRMAACWRVRNRFSGTRSKRGRSLDLAHSMVSAVRRRMPCS